MEQIQFIGSTPDQLKKEITQDVIKGVTISLLSELKKEFQPKEPTTYLQRQELAKMLNVDLSTIHNWTRKGILTAFQIGGRVYYKRSQIEQQIIELKK
ncbi:helix-turn-helix domain-containing protein [Mariniflexile maritimum]|uniref:helix-turn-helix domain-containing protein n=1 Tax=Mariniflexile maritimum TaxID=2682493 RepID=UPI0012F63236|nr:helix-turn-helix domain-containing protein [Mariniflexile maritimum]